MINNLEKLIRIGSIPICASKSNLNMIYRKNHSNIWKQLEWLFNQKNGFYAFESALHIFPSNCSDFAISIEQWNNQSLWKNNFENYLFEICFFGEDLFGCQFGIQNEMVIKFDPETCEIDFFSNDLNEWAFKILEDYNVETGYSLGSDWQKINGKIKEGSRLIPKVPFVLGGEFEIENLYEIEAVKGMNLRADLWKQIKDLPEGANIEIKLI